MVKHEKLQQLSHASTFWRMKIKKVFPLVKTLGCFQKRGTPKWMVKIKENPIKIDDLGGFPLKIMENPIKMDDLGGFPPFLVQHPL